MQTAFVGDRRPIVSAVSLIVFTALLSRGAAAQLYGVNTTGATTTLYLMNTTTGSATPVVNLSNLSFVSDTGLGELNGQLYISDVDVDPGLPTDYRFGRVNATTGAFTSVNNQGGSSSWAGLTGNTDANLLYTVDHDGAQKVLRTVTPAGVVTPIGPTGVTIIAGMAYDFEHDILYGVGGDGSPGSLYRLNTSTGAATLIGPLGNVDLDFFTIFLGLAYDPTDDTLYMNYADSGQSSPDRDALYRVNTSTGQASFVGFNGPTNGIGIDGLAYIPEPGSVAASLLLVQLLCRRGRR